MKALKQTQFPKRPQGGLSTLIIIALILSAVFLYISPSQKETSEVPLSTFLEGVRNGEVEKVTVKENRLNIIYENGTEAYAIKEPSQNVTELLEGVPEEARQAIKIEVVDTQASNFWINLLISVVPFLLIVGFFLFMFKQAQQSNNQALSFGKSKARVFDTEKRKTTFSDVAGAENAKQELVEVVDFLKNPNKYTAIGAKIPRGVLLVGAPGTGKTLLARAVAGEANVPFFNISGSEFVEMFVGVGASRVRDLFKKAKRNSPCIIFIDEIDAVGRQRGAGLGGGHDEREQTLNQILTEMDGFETDENVIVMAATNRPDVLDPALLRPGRFDRRVVVDKPDIKDREAILNVHARNKPLAKDVDLAKIARQTSGFVGADLENLLNEAALLAARHNKKKVNQNDIENSIEKVLMGPERKSKVMSKRERRVTAYHEIGHALVGHMMPECDPVHKISIISRGMALGATWFMPEEDKHLYSKKKYQSELASLLGGYVAEELTFGKENVTTGASNDLEKATDIARKMVTQFGMSDLGQVIYGEKNHEVFLGRDFGHVKNYSEEISSKIDKEVRRFIDEAYETAKKTLTKFKDKLEEIAEVLLEKETISREEFLEFFKEKKRVEVKVEK
ncbi:cell division protein FtsH [Candidatus Peregrinibacteria bacterium CG11_big_fil_rev_8_21_14_0_20_46_8]|nr:MAG: cell division protein FtsH [Candidatus Peregrinibacteria bacterium CG11_big_fil_rev_8_21_14_0_20_46_8]